MVFGLLKQLQEILWEVSGIMTLGAEEADVALISIICRDHGFTIEFINIYKMKWRCHSGSAGWGEEKT